MLLRQLNNVLFFTQISTDEIMQISTDFVSVIYLFLFPHSVIPLIF